jgi:hypothetical protein
MYDVLTLMRADLQRVILGLDHVLADTQDHEARIRAIESADYVTEDALRERSNRGLVVASTAATIVSTVAAVVAVIITR